MARSLLGVFSAGIDVPFELPTFFLENRSLLERFADLMSHPNLILNISAEDDPVQRMLTVVRWFLSAWHVQPKVPAVQDAFLLSLQYAYCVACVFAYEECEEALKPGSW